MKYLRTGLLLIFFSAVVGSRTACLSSSSAADLAFSASNVRVVSGTDASAYLSLDLEVYNASDTRKVDLPRDLSFQLTDEFGNNYSLLENQRGDSARKKEVTSVYPGQKQTLKLSFELPVAKAASATLSIAPAPPSVPDEVRLPLSLQRNEKAESVTIVSPENGTVVQQGDLVHLNVSVEGPRPPDGIIVDAFDYTYEDRDPTLLNVYDLNVPSDFALGGQSVHVIAKWDNKNSEALTASAGIILFVRSSSPVVDLQE